MTSSSSILDSSSLLSSSGSEELPSTWSEANSQSIIQNCVPLLTSHSHKGSSGRIGILGGSARYTGAPYYASMAALKVGADLAFVFCAEEAAIPIKCYSPELMVAPVYNAATFDRAAVGYDISSGEDDNNEEREGLVSAMVSEVTALFDRMHVLVIGPGLGRCPLVLRATGRILSQAKVRGLPVVVDADGLFLFTQKPYINLLLENNNNNNNNNNNSGGNIVLTPNAVEYKRLMRALAEHGGTSFERMMDGVVIVQKGEHDSISMTTTTATAGVEGESKEGDNNLSSTTIQMICKERGGLKRSGGIGDVLSGTVGTLIAWNRILLRQKQSMKEENSTHLLVLACWTACCIVKRSTRNAFDLKRRAMTAPDVLDHLGEVVDEMIGQSIVDMDDEGSESKL